MAFQLKCEAGWLSGLCICLSLFAFFGCRNDSVEEAEHHHPAHKPATFPSAVERLLALQVEIRQGTSRPTGQIDVFSEAYDIVRWLPDLAADSDLKEESWNRIDHVARQMEAMLADVLCQPEDSRRQAFLLYEPELDQNQRQLNEIKQAFPAAASAADEPT